MDTWEWRMYWYYLGYFLGPYGTPLRDYLRVWYIYLYTYTPQTIYAFLETDIAPEIGWLEH